MIDQKAAYALWRDELKNPVPVERRADRPITPLLMLGFWRMEAAKTKPDWPVAIWASFDPKVNPSQTVIWQIGGMMYDTANNADKWEDFTQRGWLHCIAVTHDEFERATKNAKDGGLGVWSDGKPARAMSADEKLGIETPTGNNEAPAEEALADQIDSLAATLDSKPIPTTQEEADLLSGLLDRMRALLKKAEDERVREKEPFLQGGRDVDTKWAAIKAPGTKAGTDAAERRKVFLKKEQDRRDAEARAENERRRKEAAEAARIERDRVAEETRRRMEAEAAEAARYGLESEPVSEEEIDAAAEAAAAEVEAAPVEEVVATRATAGAAYGRATGLRKVKRGKITDMVKFLTSVKDHDDIKELAQKIADRIAKTGLPVDGMEVETVQE